MIKTYFTAIFAAIFCVLGAGAQSLYTDPVPLQQNSQNVKIYFDAKGTDLENLPATSRIYAHTGYCTATSSWVKAPTWGDNSEKYLLTNQGGNLWMLYIGNINTYYGVPSGTKVTGLNFVFRAAGNSPQTGDMYVKVYDTGLQINLSSNVEENLVMPYTYVKLTVNSTENAKLSISINGTQIASKDNVNTLTAEYGVEKEGDYIFEATAEANGKTASEAMKVKCLAASAKADYPGGIPIMGPVENADGSVTFCFGAPLKDHVVLVGSWNNFAIVSEQVMNYQETENGKYFWTTVKGLDPQKMYTYYYIIDGGKYTVGDPYARLVLDPENDKYLDTNVFPNLPAYPWDALGGQYVPVAVYYGNINDYAWKVNDFEIPDKSNLIIYELLFRDFTGTEGKALGNGTVKQALAKLPYLKELGVNAIEVLPIMDFNGNKSWGYNPNFYFAVDKAYGTPADYKEFIDACHQNGMAVILDMVFNQSDGQHPWYQMYTRQQNPFYNFNFAGENGAPHAYSVLNDWNQGNPMVQQQWADVLRYWMVEYKFDGFRFDLVKGLGLNSSYASASDAATNAYNASRVEEMRYLQKIMDEVNPEAIFINENLAFAKEENEMAETGQLNWANVNEAACQFAMGYSDKSDMNRLYAPLDSRTWGSTVSYLESHDEERLAYKQNQWGVAGVKGNDKVSMWRCGSAAAQMIMSPGAHMIWQFSEMGNSQTTKDANGGNNTGNKVVNWALLDNPNHRGLYDDYCQLISVRLSNPEMFTKDASFSMACGSKNWSDGRWLYSVSADKSKELYTLINPNVSGTLTIPNVPFLKADNNSYKVMACSNGSTPSFNAGAGTVSVPANCFVTIGSVSLEESGVETIKSDDALNNLRVRGGYGEVVIDYCSSRAEVYSTDGRQIAIISESGCISAAPGIYIVKSGKFSAKVIVR